MSTYPIDISRQLTPEHPNWPGDTPLSVQPTAQIAQGASVNVSALQSSTHTGTHVDAPFHYSDAGDTIEKIPLSRYSGACVVVDARQFVEPSVGQSGTLISIRLFQDMPAQLPERLLLYTGEPAHWSHFPAEITALSPDVVHEASRRGVRLIGTDAPSIDPLESKTLAAHQACLQTGTLILEGLALEHVEVGSYDLVCLPLALVGVDGAPARAVLWPAGTLETR